MAEQKWAGLTRAVDQYRKERNRLATAGGEQTQPTQPPPSQPGGEQKQPPPPPPPPPPPAPAPTPPPAPSGEQQYVPPPPPPPPVSAPSNRYTAPPPQDFPVVAPTPSYSPDVVQYALELLSYDPPRDPTDPYGADSLGGGVSDFLSEAAALPTPDWALGNPALAGMAPGPMWGTIQPETAGIGSESVQDPLAIAVDRNNPAARYLQALLAHIGGGVYNIGDVLNPTGVGYR